MLRNIGGSFGIAGLSTLLSRRERFHSVRIGESVSLAAASRDGIDEAANHFLLSGIDNYSAHRRTIGGLGVIASRSYVMAFDDCFLALGRVLLLSLVAVVFLRKSVVTAGMGH
jgi:MFS transporter, DHA2 family, multidrug resistance protein